MIININIFKQDDWNLDRLSEIDFLIHLDNPVFKDLESFRNFISKQFEFDSEDSLEFLVNEETFKSLKDDSITQKKLFNEDTFETFNFAKITEETLKKSFYILSKLITFERDE